MAENFDYQQYLAAKKSVDDRALNPEVFSAFETVLNDETEADPVKVLEIGAGIGTMVERILSMEKKPHWDYTILDLDPVGIEIAFNRLQRHLDQQGWEMTTSRSDQLIKAQKQHRTLIVRFRTANAMQFASHENHHGQYDVLLANAVLDIFHIESALPVLFQALTSGGLYYFTLNYNGRTAFLPPVDPEWETLVEARYNASMDRISIAGNPRSGSRTGDNLLAYLERETELLIYGDSDWKVTPVENGYHYEEEFFIRCILNTMERALTGDPMLDQSFFRKWMETRYQQLEAGELSLKAHNMDFCGILREEWQR